MQNGWPSATYDGVQPNSPYAVADIQNEQKKLFMFILSSPFDQQDYFVLLDKKCHIFKNRSIGWFAHSYNDQKVEGYGIYGFDGALTFPFQPRTSC